MKQLLLVLILMPLVIHGQENSGIHFQQSLSWGQVVEKAKKEGKYIFVDCYASWCGPCKLMDDSVYPIGSVGDYMNAHFICVKLQMDATLDDAASVKSRYADAKAILTNYHITAFPSLLFFSPEGEFICKAIGYRQPDALVNLSKRAFDPQRQYFNLMNAYGHQHIADSTIFYLIQQSLDLGDSSRGKSIVRNYIDNDLEGFRNPKLLNKQNIDFIVHCSQLGYLSPNDAMHIFKLFQENSNTFKVITGDTPDRFLGFLIGKVDIDPYILLAINSGTAAPDWEKIRRRIHRNFNAVYADKTITSAEIRWYEWKQNWPKFCKYVFRFVQGYGADMNDFDLNMYSWKIFQHSQSIEELNGAVGWIEKVMERTPNRPDVIDTHANLLYKLGKGFNAIAEEERAVQLSSGAKDIDENYLKMKKGEPTWVNN